MSEKLEDLTRAMEANPALRAALRQAVDQGGEGAADRLAQVAQSAGLDMAPEDFVPALNAVSVQDDALEQVDGGQKKVVTALGCYVPPKDGATSRFWSKIFG